MQTVKLTLQYDGTRYAGFQRQHNGLAIQEVLETALCKVTGSPQMQIGGAAGRTDAGVHARGQVVHFCTERYIPIDRWPYALNQYMPPDVRVIRAEAVVDQFHARYWAVSKRYRYTIENAAFPSPLNRLYTYFWSHELNLNKMQEAARLLIGRHDFAAFRSVGGAARTSVRTILELAVSTVPPFVFIDVESDGFLYHMVRILAGTLLEVGAGRRSLEAVAEALCSGQRHFAGKTLPPQGLCLEEVRYGEGAGGILLLE